MDKYDQSSAQNFIEQIDRMAVERKAHFASMSIKQKVEMIYRLANNAAKKDDIRSSVSEIAFHILEDIGNGKS